MHMQPFEVIANALGVLGLIMLVLIHVYGRRHFEPPDDEAHRTRR